MVEDTSLFAEIDESLRIDNVEKFLRQYGKLIIAGCVAIVLSTAASVWWKSHMQEVHMKETSVLLEVQELMDAKKYDDALQKLETLDHASSGIPAIARLMRAEIYLDEQQPEQAKKLYDEIAQGNTDPNLRSLSTIDSSILADGSHQASDMDALKKLYIHNEPFDYLAGELYALNLAKSGKSKEARDILSDISNNNDLPMSVRSQAKDFLGTIKDKE